MSELLWSAARGCGGPRQPPSHRPTLRARGARSRRGRGSLLQAAAEAVRPAGSSMHGRPPGAASFSRMDEITAGSFDASGRPEPTAYIPRPPALLTAATSCGVVEPDIGA
jgi:hypothetical protein